ncbi:hypothetical protein ACC688_37435, partial [Rhizobium ruizarguesonis]
CYSLFETTCTTRKETTYERNHPVTGAAGQLGQRVIHHLIETYKFAPGNIVAATRSPEKLSELEKKGGVTRKADFDD